MPVTLSIKNVPDNVADALRERARSNQRSLQGELLTIVEQAANQPKALTLREIYDRGRRWDSPPSEASPSGLCAGCAKSGQSRSRASSGRRVVVVDASALAAVLFSEPEGVEVLDALAGDEVAAPAMLPFELTNIARTKTRQHPDDTAIIEANLKAGLLRPIAIVAVDFSEVLDLALTTGLSAYDASYLWLSRHLGVPLVTLDKKLGAHAKHR